MIVKLIAYTPNPERVVAAAAKLCYSPVGVDRITEKMTYEEAASFVRMLVKIGHLSPIEHASFTFAIEGVSRSLLAQITRHRIASFSVQSQRFVRLDDFNYVIPPEIENDPAANAVFVEAMNRQATEYMSLVGLLQERHAAALVKQGIDEKTAIKKAEKMANEDARFVLPNACETKMIVTMNARSLLNFFSLRCCNRAQWEIRELAERMFRLVYWVAPSIFEIAGPGCVSCGKCSEGKMTCGHATDVRAKWEKWKLEEPETEWCLISTP